jgi:beta-lactamase class D
MRTPLFVLFLVPLSVHAAPIATTFVLRDLDTGETSVDNPEMAARGYPPCSTFKIPNTLIGLQTGVIPDDKFSLKWDGVHRRIEAWNRDQTLDSALRESVLWFYQEVARRVGEPRMRAWVTRLDYGNRDIGGGLDHFWLDGAMRVTPRQQVEFLSRLVTPRSPVLREHVALVRRILTLDSSPPLTLIGKTGSGTYAGEDLAWLVGWIDTPAHHYAYAYLAVAKPGEAPSREARTALVRERLVAHGVLRP